MTPEQILDSVIARDEIIPWEEVRLPSAGVYYKKDGKPLFPDGTVKVRAMGMYADKAMASARLRHGFKMLDYLFRWCVRFPVPDFNSADLLHGDRMFLLYYLRGITHGNMYEFLAKCPNPECGHQSEYAYDLNELVRTVKGPNLDIGDEPFKVSLPYLSKITQSDFWVKVRLLRGRDVEAMLTRRNVTKIMHPKRVRPRSEAAEADDVKDMGLDETVSKNLSMVITEVMDSTDAFKIAQLVEKMHSQDTEAIRTFLDENSPGIEYQIVVTCPQCETEATLDLPITETFFRPAKRRRA
jgi:hypothetical protein